MLPRSLMDGAGEQSAALTRAHFANTAVASTGARMAKRGARGRPLDRRPARAQFGVLLQYVGKSIGTPAAYGSGDTL